MYIVARLEATGLCTRLTRGLFQGCSSANRLAVTGVVMGAGVCDWRCGTPGGVPTVLSTASKLIGGVAAFALIGVLGPGTTAERAEASHPTYSGGADAFSIDMDPFGTTPNTATSLGPRENCASLMPNGLQDADEDGVDLLTFDVTVAEIPESSPIFAFEFEVEHTGQSVAILRSNSAFLMAANPLSQVYDVSAPTNDGWYGGAVDFAPEPWAAAESGSGVVSRLELTTVGEAPSGIYALNLVTAYHVDPIPAGYLPDIVEPAMVAVGIACPSASDSDSDGVNDLDEAGCGGDAVDPTVKPEIQDNGVDDDNNGYVDEGMNYWEAKWFDCDGDGYLGYQESHVFGQSQSAGGNQYPCGAIWKDAYYSLWPADITADGRVNIHDLATFAAPIRRLGTTVGTQNFLVRFDLVPDNAIDVEDIASLVTVAPPMLGGVRAFNGPPCPWPP